jgi:hypothetical protein
MRQPSSYVGLSMGQDVGGGNAMQSSYRRVTENRARTTLSGFDLCL